MKAITYIHMSARLQVTRQKLIDAAARVFNRVGLAGSTTRAIALEAGVNEVTLFRHFQTKEKLVSAVIGQTFDTTGVTAPVATGDLKADLSQHARYYEKMLIDNLSIVRTLLGEIQHPREQERQIFRGIFRPLRTTLITLLQDAKTRGAIRSELPPDILADMFNGLFFTNVIRRSSPHSTPEYSTSTHLSTAVDFFLRGCSV